jgi:hypothetical protein
MVHFEDWPGVRIILRNMRSEKRTKTLMNFSAVAA